jgi:hypothetical protein
MSTIVTVDVAELGTGAVVEDAAGRTWTMADSGMFQRESTDPDGHLVADWASLAHLGEHHGPVKLIRRGVPA